MSGAGRSQAADIFEDLGYFVIDNLPPELIPKVAELAQAPASSIGKVVLVVGTGPHHGEVLPALSQLRRQGHQLRILFLEASTDVLVRRYESTRRRHPLAGSDHSLADSIEAERQLLGAVKAEADIVINTSDLNVHQLRGRVVDLFANDDDAAQMNITVMSFGYKFGLPIDTDLVFDCRFLPNPHWVESLRDKTGIDRDVSDYVLSQPIAVEFMDDIVALLRKLLPAYVAEGKSYLTVAFGCTGGRHRSVAIAEAVAKALSDAGITLRVNHRDKDR